MALFFASSANEFRKSADLAVVASWVVVYIAVLSLFAGIALLIQELGPERALVIALQIARRVGIGVVAVTT